MKDWVRASLWVLFFGLIISILMHGAIWLSQYIQETAMTRCADLGTQLGYETELLSGYCYIKVRPGLKVREDLVLHYLPVIDCR